MRTPCEILDSIRDRQFHTVRRVRVSLLWRKVDSIQDQDYDKLQLIDSFLCTRTDKWYLICSHYFLSIEGWAVGTLWINHSRCNGYGSIDKYLVWIFLSLCVSSISYLGVYQPSPNQRNKIDFLRFSQVVLVSYSTGDRRHSQHVCSVYLISWHLVQALGERR